MWGSWSVLSLAGVVAAGLLIGLIVLGSPLFAVVIAAAGALAFVAFAALRRSDEYVERSERARVRRDAADIAASSQPDRGAPAGGEGGSGTRTELPATPGGPTRSSA
jgi:hypothetical protein